MQSATSVITSYTQNDLSAAERVLLQSGEWKRHVRMANPGPPRLPQNVPVPQPAPQPEFTKYLNVEIAKIVAFLMVISFVLYHGVIHMKYGSDSCKWLLSDGRFQGYNAWQPYGCMMHKYTKSDSRNCMHYISYWGGKNHVVFIGDSRIRQLYFQFVDMLSDEPVSQEKVHSDLSFTDQKINLKVEFLWHPMVNKSMSNVYKSWLQRAPQDRPNQVVTGSASWSIKVFNGSQEALQNFSVNLTHTVHYINKISNTTNILWMLQDPVVESKLSANRSMITNSQIDDYNKAALDVLMYNSATIWSSSRLVAQGYNRDTQDGLHIGKLALDLDVQILMNMYCNDHMNYNDGTCCSSAESISTLQIVVAAVFGVCLLTSIVLCIWRRKFRRSVKNGAKARAENPQRSNGQKNGATGSEADRCEGFYELITSLAKLGIIMSYFFLCDRTSFFMKENKYYTHVNFFLPFSYLMILGFFFTENSDQTRILHRDQTAEWKGWMQLVILIYHLTGASRVLPIYMQIRVLVSSYIFLSAFGHFTYFYNKSDYSLRRVCQVLFRNNCLVVTLCFVMDRPYQFYYFVPLVSFWFLMCYITMAIWPHVTTLSCDTNGLHYLYMVLKFVVVIVAITLLYASEVFFEKIFLTHPIKALFVTSDDSIHEWRFRWQLDRYSTVYGMGFAFSLMVAKKFNFMDDKREDAIFSKGLSWFAGILSVCGIGGYAVFANFCRNKQECNEVHAYISFLPIISYIFLRNIPGWLRTKYSSFFAWFGKISLELFIAQYHIWLAADTHGVLVLLPSYPVLNIIVTSFIFVCIAHEINSLTGILTKYAVPEDWKLILRNCFCFGAVLLPIAITHGVLGF